LQLLFSWFSCCHSWWSRTLSSNVETRLSDNLPAIRLEWLAYIFA
jgi:hypothetical protein